MNNPVIPEDILSFSRKKAIEFNRMIKNPNPEFVEPGQIWATYASIELPDGRRFETDNPRLIVILDGSGHPDSTFDQLTVAPISLFIEMASEYDVICRTSVSSLGFDFMAEVWNETPIIKKHLRQCLGRMVDEAKAALLELYSCKMASIEIPSTLAEWVGPALMGSEDPRVTFQEAELEATAYLAQAATATLGLEDSVAEAEETATQLLAQVWSFKLQPVLAKLSDFLRGPAIAYAAGRREERETQVIHYEEGDRYFTGEVLFRQRTPYTIYLKVHQISPTLKGSKAVVTVISSGKEWKSEVTELGIDKQIQVGQDAAFKLDQVDSVEIEIRQMGDSRG